MDDAHKLSATVSGGVVRATRRFQLGRMLSNVTRHYLLLTATPHNGKEEDFQLFLSLVDQDRFGGVARTGAQTINVADIMRRLVKEEFLKFDGTPLFPERYAASFLGTLRRHCELIPFPRLRQSCTRLSLATCKTSSIVRKS